LDVCCEIKELIIMVPHVFPSFKRKAAGIV